MIRKIFFSIFLITLSFNVNASSNIAFIDINYIIEKSNYGIQITELLKKKRDKETKTLDLKKKEIKKKENEFKSKSNILSEDEKQKRVESIKKDINDFNLLKKKLEKDFNIKKTEYINILLKEINTIMIAHIEKNSIDIVVKKENLVTGKKELDITKIILDQLNKKKITIK
tara:strand:+ start:595 stop:1107 length:513 start_codon:yes stop_codon:yes gene_type:complete